MAVTAQEIINDARHELKDTTGVTYNFPDAELFVYISDAVEDLTGKIAAHWPEFWISTPYTLVDTQNIVAATANYNLPADLYQIIKVELTSAVGDFSELTPLGLVRSQNPNADGYLLRNDDIYIYPTPTVNVANGLNIFYVSRAARIIAGGTNVRLADNFRGYIKEYLVLKCKARQDENPQAFVAFFSRFERYLNSMMLHVNMGRNEGWTIPRRWLV